MEAEASFSGEDGQPCYAQDHAHLIHLGLCRSTMLAAPQTEADRTVWVWDLIQATKAV